MSDATLDLKQFIRDIPDFPKPGILFRDITPLLAHPEALRETVRRMAEPYRGQEDQRGRRGRGPRLHLRRADGD